MTNNLTAQAQKSVAKPEQRCRIQKETKGCDAKILFHPVSWREGFILIIGVSQLYPFKCGEMYIDQFISFATDNAGFAKGLSTPISICKILLRP